MRDPKKRSILVFMKKLTFLLFLFSGLVFLQAQPQVLQTTQSFTTATTGNVIQNDPTLSGGPAGWIAFRMVYYIQAGSGTVSALSVELDGAATSGGSYSALTPAVGGGSGSGSTLNPVTSFPQGQNVLCCDYYPFLKIKVNTLTVASGSPILIVKVIGYAGTSAAAGTGGGGGGSGITALTQDVLASGSGSVAATVVGIDTVPLCSGFSPSNGQFLEYTTGGSPSPCYSAAAASGGSGGGSGLTVYSGLAAVSLSGATVYFPVGGGSAASATEASVSTYQGTGGTVSGFGASISAALGTTTGTHNSVVLTWRKNATGQTVTCTITDPATTCSDTTHSFTYAAADALDVQAVFTGTIIATPVWVLTASVSSASTLCYWSQVVTSGSATTVSFTGIPGTCTNLHLSYQARTTAAVNVAALYLEINSDTTAADYTGQYIYAQDTTLASAVLPTTTSGIQLSNVPGTSTTAGYSAAGVVSIPSFSGTTFFKRMLAQGGYGNSASGVDILFPTTFTWTSTAAITGLLFSLASGDAFVDGSTFTLYTER